MRRESKQVWCVVLDPKGAVKVQGVNMYLRRGTGGWGHSEWWEQASASKTEVLGEFNGEDAARAALPAVVKRRANKLHRALTRATEEREVAESAEQLCRGRYEAWVVTAKAAGVEL